MIVIMGVHLVAMKSAQHVTVLMGMNSLEQHAVTPILICSLMEISSASPALSFILIVPLVSLILSHRVASVKKDIL